MTVREVRTWLVDALSGISVEPEAEARWMLKAVAANASSCERSQINGSEISKAGDGDFLKIAGSDVSQTIGSGAMHIIGSDALRTLESYIEERKRGRPLQYILGEWDFYGLPIKTREGALIPRPETEILVEIALKRAKERNFTTSLEIGAGSGCVAVALRKFGNFASITATDISPEALTIARENAYLNGVSIEFLQGEWYAPVKGRKFDLIISNPPYIPTADLAALQPELSHEPRQALDGGKDGLEAYRALAKSLATHLTKTGAAFFETGHDQAPPIRKLLEGHGFCTRVHLDLAGVSRFVEAWALCVG